MYVSTHVFPLVLRQLNGVTVGRPLTSCLSYADAHALYYKVSPKEVHHRQKYTQYFLNFLAENQSIWKLTFLLICSGKKWECFEILISRYEQLNIQRHVKPNYLRTCIVMYSTWLHTHVMNSSKSFEKYVKLCIIKWFCKLSASCVISSPESVTRVAMYCYILSSETPL